MDHYPKSGSQSIHIQKRLAYIDLQCFDLSWKTTCRQLGICWYSPLLTNTMENVSGKLGPRMHWYFLPKSCTWFLLAFGMRVLQTQFTIED